METEISSLYQLLISLGLGLLVGLQRQWVGAPLAGIRTFSLIALLGTSSALLANRYDNWLVVAGLVGTTAAMIVGHVSKRSADNGQEHSGLATEFAMLLMYVIGVLVHVGPIWLPAALAGILAVVLQAKFELHNLVSRFSEKEIKAVMQFVLISLVIFPVFPDRTYGPLEVLNPRNIWLMVILIVAISLAGYIIYKFFGEKAGVVLGGILGGVIASTATTLAYARTSSGSPKNISRNGLIILIAWTVVYVRLFIEITVAAPEFRESWAPLGIMFLVSFFSALWSWRVSDKDSKGMPTLQNPTELKIALSFGLLYSIILVAIAWAKEYFGSGGLTVVTAFSGIADMDAITLSTARLVTLGKIAPDHGWRLLVIAVMANTCFKGVLTLVVGGRALFSKVVVPWVALLATGLLLLLVW